MALNTKRDHDAVQLIAASPSLATEGWSLEGEGDSHRLAYQVNAFVFVLDVTATASVAGDWLLVYIQTKLDGTNWTDVTSGAFTQATTTTIERITVATFDGAFVRIAWTITGGTPSFTFNVRVIGKCQ